MRAPSNRRTLTTQDVHATTLPVPAEVMERLVDNPVDLALDVGRQLALE